MPLDLAPLLRAPLPPGTKGLPLTQPGFAAADIAAQDWRLFTDLPMPVAVIKRSAADGNIRAMQRYLAAAGARIAPHGKTTMCPQLFERQLDEGAWGITVANVTQAALCRQIGVPRILIANELGGAAEAAMLAEFCAGAGAPEIYSLVDSAATVDLLDDAFARAGGAPARVLLEMGMAGGRTGVRSIADGVAVARLVAARDHVTLAGAEAYEGLIVTGDSAADARAVRAFLADFVALTERLRAEGLFADAGDVLITAGGSAYYDLVALLLAAGRDAVSTVVLRSGCYVTHDVGFYAGHGDAIAERALLGPPPAFTNALEVWTRVQSVPEPGLAILSAGKRDLSYDIDLPRPLACHTADGLGAIAGWAVEKLSDQHAFFRATAPGTATPLAVGDLVALGISHPCTTFDKWSLLLEVDDDYRVIGGLRTFF